MTRSPAARWRGLFKRTKTDKDMNIRSNLKDILLIISWRQFSRQYFGKSASWIYHKIDGIDELTEAERLKFRESLLSLSETIRDTASRL